MKRKILLCLAAVALITVISLLPVQAAETTCPCCGISGSDPAWQPWTITDGGTNNTLLADGHYYLTGDVTSIKSQIRIGEGTEKVHITLDLRGHTMTALKRVFGVYGGSTLSIVDSVGGGKVQGKQTDDAQVGGVIRINDGATCNLYGGTVEDVSTKAHAAKGGVIATEGKNCVINIAGGHVVGGTYAPLGGAIYAANNATVSVSAGSVTGGIADAGGAIYLYKATLNITGGTVTGGTATRENLSENNTAGCGGAVYAMGSAVTVDGGTVVGGEAYHGGAFALMASTLDISSGTVNGSTVSGYGAAIHLLADTVNQTAIPCTVNITGGTVTAPQNTGRSAITLASNAHTLNMSGGTITGAGKSAQGGAAISGQGTAAIVNITGGTITGAASMSVSRSGVVYSRGFVNISGGDIQVTAGDGPAVYMYQSYGLLTITGTAGDTLPGKVRLVENAKVYGGSGALAVVNGVTDGLWYMRGVDAVNNLPEGGFVRSFGGGILNLQGKTVPVDVNGQTMKIRNGTFYGFDSTNDTFNDEKHGTVTLDGGVLAATAYSAPTGNHYVAVTADDGKLSFHRCEMVLTDVSLRTTAGKEGLYYSANIRADKSAISVLKGYGIAVTVREQPATDADWTANMDGAVKRSVYGPGSLKPSSVNTVNSTSVVNIIHINNTTKQNSLNGATQIYARPYVEVADGGFLYGTVADTNMQQVALQADVMWNDLSDNQKKGLLGMYERFNASFRDWTLPNLKAAYISGDPDVDALVLQYRREMVVETMRAQLQILWTVDRKVVYSKSSASKGPDADLAQYNEAQLAAGKTPNPLNDQIITLYPDRIYQGLPYTHASASTDAFGLLGQQDENGVYHVYNANTSLFNGGSTDGSEVDKTTGQRTGQYNVARLGNDCWDMVHFAWGKLAGDITSTATRELTPSYNIQWLGEDILTQAMIDNKYVAPDGYDMTAPGSNLLDCICAKNSRGKYVFKGIADTVEGGTTDGTRLVRYGTRTQNADGTYDYQALYKTYAMLQPGDGVVQWRNGSGHAMMITGVNVVYKSDNTIDGDKSTVTLLEQGSGHEERQSRLVSEFDSAVTAKHSSHTSANNNCLYCAGYTDQVIDGKHVWKIDYCDDQTRSFTQLQEGDCIAFTCRQLQVVEKPVGAYVTLSKEGHGFTGLFTGRLTASYRITTVTLNISGENGKSFSTGCVTLQSQVSQHFAMSRLLTDGSCGIDGSSVQTAKLPVCQDESGQISADLSKMPAGKYSFSLVVQLNSGHQIEVKSGTFRVDTDGTVVEAPQSIPTVPSAPSEPQE